MRLSEIIGKVDNKFAYIKYFLYLWCIKKSIIMCCDYCRRNKQSVLYSYGGQSVCFYCLEQLNPIVVTYKKLSPTNRKHLEARKWELEKELRSINNDLNIDNRMVRENRQTLDFIRPREVPHYIRKGI